MAADRIAIYETTILGDFLLKTETVSTGGDTADFLPAENAGFAAVNDKGPASTFTIALIARLFRGHSGTETFEAFLKRRIEFVEAMRDRKRNALASSASDTDDLVLVTDSDADKSTVDGAVTADPGASVTLDDDLSLQVNDRFIVLQPGVPSYEILKVDSVDSALTFTSQVDFNIADASEIYRAHVVWPGCYLMGDIAVGGEEGRGAFVTEDVALTFQTTESPEFTGDS